MSWERIRLDGVYKFSFEVVYRGAESFEAKCETHVPNKILGIPIGRKWSSDGQKPIVEMTSTGKAIITCQIFEDEPLEYRLSFRGILPSKLKTDWFCIKGIYFTWTDYERFSIERLPDPSPGLAQFQVKSPDASDIMQECYFLPSNAYGRSSRDYSCGYFSFGDFHDYQKTLTIKKEVDHEAEYYLRLILLKNKNNNFQQDSYVLTFRGIFF
jgi:hypothetical protein